MKQRYYSVLPDIPIFTMDHSISDNVFNHQCWALFAGTTNPRALWQACATSTPRSRWRFSGVQRWSIRRFLSERSPGLAFGGLLRWWWEENLAFSLAVGNENSGRGGVDLCRKVHLQKVRIGLVPSCGATCCWCQWTFPVEPQAGSFHRITR